MRLFSREKPVAEVAPNPETQFAPEQLVTVDFEPAFDEPSVLISTHVDTIQALFVEGQKNKDLELFVLGRVLDGQQDRILEDGVFKLFTGLRAAGRAEALSALNSQIEEENGTVLTRPRLTPDMSTDEPFKCKFYSLNQIVSEIEAGITSPNRLMPVFGGITTMQFGSYTASRDGLERFAREFRVTVWDRQYGGVALSALIAADKKVPVSPPRLDLNTIIRQPRNNSKLNYSDKFNNNYYNNNNY